MAAICPESRIPACDEPPRPCRYHATDYCHRPAEPGYKSCRPCRTNRSARQYRKRISRIAAGLCCYNGCDRSPIQGNLCPKHSQALKDRNKRRRERYRAAGLCFQCGRRPPAYGYSVCWPCQVKRQESNRASYARNGRPARSRAKPSLSPDPAGPGPGQDPATGTTTSSSPKPGAKTRP